MHRRIRCALAVALAALVACPMPAAAQTCSSVVPVCRPPPGSRRLAGVEQAAPARPLGVPPNPRADADLDGSSSVPQRVHDSQQGPAEDPRQQAALVARLNRLLPDLPGTLDTPPAQAASDSGSPGQQPGSGSGAGVQPPASAALPAVGGDPDDSDPRQRGGGLQPLPAPSQACPAGGGAACAAAAAAAAPPPSRQSRYIPDSAAPSAADAGPYVGPATMLDGKPVMLENAWIKVGVDARRAGAITWVSSGAPTMPGAWKGRNLVNNWDCGRLLQQSFYGCRDASCWYDKAWLWNPVQAGSWQNFNGRTLSSEVVPGKRITVKGNGRNWGGQQVIGDIEFTTDVVLSGKLVVVNYTMRYGGTVRHPYMTQETPAVFPVRNLSVLAYYDGAAPFKNQSIKYAFPPGRNIVVRPTERWAAYVDPDTGAALGVFAPSAWAGVTAYRTGWDKSDRPYHTSYMAHTTRMALAPGMKTYNYQVYVAAGPLTEVRRTFNALAADPKVLPPEVLKDILQRARGPTEPDLGQGQPELGRGGLDGRLPTLYPVAGTLDAANDDAAGGSAGAAQGGGGGAAAAGGGAGTTGAQQRGPQEGPAQPPPGSDPADDGAAAAAAPAPSGGRPGASSRAIAGAAAAAAGAAVVAAVAATTAVLSRRLQRTGAAAAAPGDGAGDDGGGSGAGDEGVAAAGGAAGGGGREGAGAAAAAATDAAPEAGRPGSGLRAAACVASADTGGGGKRL